MSRTPERERAFATSDFDYDLPPELIAHHPAPERDASRLLVVRRDTGEIRHRSFRDILDLVAPGDVLVLNETRVFPARLLGTRAGGGAAEVVLLRPAAAGSGTPGDAWPQDWLALVRPGARLRAGRSIRIAEDLTVDVAQVNDDGSRVVRLRADGEIRSAVFRHGRMPLPPYIERAVEPADNERYQTVFARTEGSVAAPTAGLHFTAALLDELRSRNVVTARVLLHVGAGTFKPVDVEDLDDHPMHEEWYEVAAEEAAKMNEARRRGGRLWAVGTTVTRTLESAARSDGHVEPGSGWTRLFIRPGYAFRAVDAMITNFHLPRSTLIMLVSAFAGHDLTRAAYAEAISRRYRFYSYGDAMAIL